MTEHELERAAETYFAQLLAMADRHGDDELVERLRAMKGNLICAFRTGCRVGSSANPARDPQEMIDDLFRDVPSIGSAKG